MKEEMIGRIEDLSIGDSFRTKTGKRTYTIVDIVYSKVADCNVWLLRGGWFVSNPDKEVVINKKITQ